MAMNDAQELLKHDLGDILYAEKQILKALKPMIREASDPEMRARLEQHQTETEQQITNVERAFEVAVLIRVPSAMRDPVGAGGIAARDLADTLFHAGTEPADLRDPAAELI